MRIVFGGHWITLHNEGGNNFLESNLKEGTDANNPDDAEYRTAIDGLEALLLSLYNAGIISVHNAVRVTDAVAEATEAIANNT